MFHKRSKHIAIKSNYTREKVESGEILLKFIGTKLMATYQMTKHVGVQAQAVGKELTGMIRG